MMTTSYISSLSLWNAPRSNVSRLQTELARANAEIATGRYADVGLQLGTQVGTSLGVRQQSAMLTALKDGNGVAGMRLSTSQTVLAQLQGTADAMLKTLTGLPEDKRAATAASGAESALSALAGGLDASTGGQYVFGGTNTKVSPIGPDGLAAAKDAVAAAFGSYFAFPVGSPATATITADRMRGFLDTLAAPGGPFAAGWGGTISRAAGEAISSQISLSERATTSVSADDPAFRTLALAYAVASGIGLTGASAAVQSVATERVMSLLGEASSGRVGLQADLGRSQQRITEANTRLDAQKALLSRAVNDLETVDPAEAKTRVDALTTQIQMSYALTAQLRQLSLVNFL